MLTAYASVLQRWSASEHFCLNLTVLNRQPLHEQVDRLVGDFTSVSLLEVDQRPSNELGGARQRHQPAIV
ncbi:iron aquisition yersiniabactin synthesis enzyme (Irp2) [Klebsiella pneumoniae]|uniref:Iron aquisition yersiniabactin synthesis enzyme (Irp2) n=1 Tax=Klebsiella pneumoniae TaxID=573 RepID=A0A377VWP1_KLEPN|nr:iron aquisition yersiniabactin synthesis enzyme (Irp2) [Klebsiella pneumoniae]